MRTAGLSDLPKVTSLSQGLKKGQSQCSESRSAALFSAPHSPFRERMRGVLGRLWVTQSAGHHGKTRSI